MKTEARIQQEIVRWYRNEHCLAHHKTRGLILSVPNEGKPDLIATGLYPGAADLIVIYITEWGPLTSFIEVKTPIGVQSPKQKKFQKHVEGMGFAYKIVRSLEEFQKFIVDL